MSWREDRDPGMRNSQAVAALGCEPQKFTTAEALLLGIGGDDGLWMRLLGSGIDDLHRCGGLVVAPEGIAYQELMVDRPMPKGWDYVLNVDKVERVSGFAGARGLFNVHRAMRQMSAAAWVWSARREEITDAVVEPAVDSPHGPYTAVTVTARSETVRFGLRLGPWRSSALTGIRELAGTGFSKDLVSGGPPRTDGIYAEGRTRKRSPDVRALWFDGMRACWFSTHDLASTTDKLRCGTSSLSTDPYRLDETGNYVIEEYNFHVVVIDDTKLIFRTESDNTGSFSDDYTELTFVSDEQIAAGWGSLRAPLTEAWWGAFMTADGKPKAPDIG